MACKNAFNGFSFSVATSSSSSSVVGRRRKGCISVKPLMAMNYDGRDFYQSLAARLLGTPTTFEASKLKVEFNGEEVNKKPFCTGPRAYTLTHCDWTANLTLAVSNSISSEQLQSWRTTLQRDDVVAEWKKMNEEMSLHVHCYVSGANLLQDLAAGVRYFVFTKELPLVLKAVIYGDAALFKEHPELMDSKVFVYFHSNSKKYNRIECWGPLKEATKRTLDDRSDGLQRGITEKVKKIVIPGTILTAALVTLLL
ncbi:protein STAY-GREEN LIKE, chloroplastic-like [Carex rostrata]